MAAADYRLCDVCGGKAFYDSNLCYEDEREAPDRAPYRIAGEASDWGYRLGYLGDWAVVCDDCAKTHRTRIEPIVATPAEPAPASTGRVKIPVTADEAAGMALVGMAWLKEHAPERLVQSIAARELDVEAERRAAVMEVFDDAAAALHEEINQTSVREAEDGDDEGQKNFLAGKMAGIVAMRVAFRRALSASKPEVAPVSTEQAGDAPKKELAHGHRDDFYLMANARRIGLMPIRRVEGMANWTLAHELFATGSNSAHQICVDAGIDPTGYTVERAPSPNNSPVGADKERK